MARACAAGMENINVRLPSAMVARADALLEVATAAPELATVGTATRSDVLRLALLRGLAVVEAELGTHPTLPGTEG